MKAIVIHKARDLRIEERDAGSPGAEQVRVTIGAGGICGSDLHYFHNGGFGSVRLKEPMILGHEVAGTVAEIGSNVARLRIGDRVAVSPSMPCYECSYCQIGQHQHCLDMHFYGSAMRMPHVQGAFRQQLIADQSQCHVVPQPVSLSDAAFAEPFSVALHAVSRAGSLAGKKVLVTGCGPIGCLCVLAARHCGSADIVATDIVGQPLKAARAVGADHAINMSSMPDGLDGYEKDKGTFDIVFEASGNAQALRKALDVVRPQGTIVQIGLGGDVSIPQNTIVTKEIQLKGTFRFHAEFEWAVRLISEKRVDLSPILTDILPFNQMQKAFELAGDRHRAIKVQLDFDDED